LSVWLLSNSAPQELRQVALVGSLGIVIFLVLGRIKRPIAQADPEVETADSEIKSEIIR
jgi:hypothetical protein